MTYDYTINMKKKLRFLHFTIYFIIFRSPEELYTEYDPAGVAFKPAVPVPKKINVQKSSIDYIMSPAFEEYVNTFSESTEEPLYIDEDYNFYEDYKNIL